MRTRSRWFSVGLILLVSACGEPSRPVAPSEDAGARTGTRQAAGNGAFNLDAMTFTSFDVPGSNSTFPMGLNADGDAVGQYTIAGSTHGFLRRVAGAFTTIDYPGASFTVAAGINSDGDITGWYNFPAAPTQRHGFLLHDGEFTTVDPAGSVFTNALGINAAGDIVGRYCTAFPCWRTLVGVWHGFLRHDGEITTVDVPASLRTNAWGIDPQGKIVGGFSDAANVTRLFVARGTEFTTFDLPGALPVSQDEGGSNPRGDIAGTFCDVTPCDLTNTAKHGFVVRQGVLTTIDVAGATATSVQKINESGGVAGAYRDAAGITRGFILLPDQ